MTVQVFRVWHRIPSRSGGVAIAQEICSLMNKTVFPPNWVCNGTEIQSQPKISPFFLIGRPGCLRRTVLGVITTFHAAKMLRWPIFLSSRAIRGLERRCLYCTAYG